MTRKEQLSQDVITAVKTALANGVFDARHLIRYTENLVNDRQDRLVLFAENPDDQDSPTLQISYSIKDPDVALPG